METGVDFKVCVILPAAGISQRMGLHQPKQFIDIVDRPLLSHTIEAFESMPWIEAIVIVTNKSKEEEIKRIVEQYQHKKVQVMVSENTSTRHRSIRCGVFKAADVVSSTDIVVIHDAVRLFVEEANLKDIVLAAHKHGAAGVSKPLVSTVLKLTKDNFLDHTLDRTKYIGSEMPQAFRYEVILNAYHKCTDYDLEYGTECLHLAQTYSNVTPIIIPGPDCLWKVTYWKDIYAAEGILKEALGSVQFVTEKEDCIEDVFKKDLVKSFEGKKLKLNFVSFQNGMLETSKDNTKAVILYHAKPPNLKQIQRCTHQAVKYVGECLRKRGIVVHVLKRYDNVCDCHTFDCITDDSNESTPCLLTNELQRDILLRSRELEPQNICLNAVVFKISGENQNRRLSFLLSDLVFDRNLNFTGQTFII